MLHASDQGGKPRRSNADAEGANGTALTVARLAAHFALPEAFLRELGLEDLPTGVVGIPYYGPGGEDLFVRQRLALEGKRRFHQPEGVPLQPYGLWRLDAAARAAHLYVAEGESDTW